MGGGGGGGGVRRILHWGTVNACSSSLKCSCGDEGIVSFILNNFDIRYPHVLLVL